MLQDFWFHLIFCQISWYFTWNHVKDPYHKITQKSCNYRGLLIMLHRSYFLGCLSYHCSFFASYSFSPSGCRFPSWYWPDWESSCACTLVHRRMTSVALAQRDQYSASAQNSKSENTSMFFKRRHFSLSTINLLKRCRSKLEQLKISKNFFTKKMN